MENYLDSVTGIYPRLEHAQAVANTLLEKGFKREQLQIIANEAASVSKAAKQGEDDKEVLKNVVVDGAIGTTIGAGIGALGQVAIVAANVSLFVASPLLAPLVMIGWGAAIGGFIGAANGISDQDKQFKDLVKDAVEQGNVVLVVNTLTDEETELARQLVRVSMEQHHVSGSENPATTLPQ